MAVIFLFQKRLNEITNERRLGQVSTPPVAATEQREADRGERGGGKQSYMVVLLEDRYHEGAAGPLPLWGKGKEVSAEHRRTTLRKKNRDDGGSSPDFHRQSGGKLKKGGPLSGGHTIQWEGSQGTGTSVGSVLAWTSRR